MTDYSSTGLHTTTEGEIESYRSQSEIHNRNNYCPRAVSIEIHDNHAVLTKETKEQTNIFSKRK